MSSNNQPIIASLVNGIAGGLSPGQSYDLLKRISEDLDVVFSIVDSKNIDITLTPESSFPDTVAFTDKLNSFSVVQTFIDIKCSSIECLGSTNVVQVRDRTNSAHSAALYRTGDITRLWSSVFGDSVVFNDAGTVGLGGATLLSAAGGTTIKNAKPLYGENAAGAAILEIAQVDVNNLVLLGGLANSSGDGHVSIPKDVAGNLPAAGATRNGIIVLDKTNNRFCYYVNGSRFWLLGTAF